ncbi:DUF1295-containing protein [Aureococcus anophagefferens]|nr:DUF1295-containing protein [Aureococcus anophagefferens]
MVDDSTPPRAPRGPRPRRRRPHARGVDGRADLAGGGLGGAAPRARGRRRGALRAAAPRRATRRARERGSRRSWPAAPPRPTPSRRRLAPRDAAARRRRRRAAAPPAARAAADLRKAAKTLAAEADAVQDGAAALRDHEAKALGLDDAADGSAAAAAAPRAGAARVDRVAALERRRDELRAAPPGALVVAPPKDDADAKYRERLAAGLHGWTAAKVGADEAVLALPHALYGTWATKRHDAARERPRSALAPDDACAAALFAAPHVWLHPAAHAVDGAVFEVAVAEKGGQKALASELARATLGAAKLQRLGKELFALQATCAMAPPAWSSSACAVAVDALVGVGRRDARSPLARYPPTRAACAAGPGRLTLAIEPGLARRAALATARSARDRASPRRGRRAPLPAHAGQPLAVCACVQRAIDQDLPPPVAEDAPGRLDRERPPKRRPR